MKFSELKVGTKIYDSWGISGRGVVTEVQKSQFKVQYLGDDESTTYDKAYAPFMEKTLGQKWKDLLK